LFLKQVINGYATTPASEIANMRRWNELSAANKALSIGEKFLTRFRFRNAPGVLLSALPITSLLSVGSTQGAFAEIDFDFVPAWHLA
jgi:hypothetical protein